MPSTAILLAAESREKFHAYRPDESTTLCGLVVVTPEEWELDGQPPPRSADAIGRRFYAGLYREMCNRCLNEAVKVRVAVVGSGATGTPLQAVR